MQAKEVFEASHCGIVSGCKLFPVKRQNNACGSDFAVSLSKTTLSPPRHVCVFGLYLARREAEENSSVHFIDIFIQAPPTPP